MGQHVACCLGFNTKYPHLLISGGRLDHEMPRRDIWLLNITSRKWKLVSYNIHVIMTAPHDDDNNASA